MMEGSQDKEYPMCNSKSKCDLKHHMRYRNKVTNPVRLKIAILFIFLVQVILTKNLMTLAFRLPQRLVTQSRFSRSRIPSLFIAQHQSSVLTSPTLTPWRSINPAYHTVHRSTTQIQNARRSTTTVSLPFKLPDVEISPNDHGTTPLKSFRADSNVKNRTVAGTLDSRLVERLEKTIGRGAVPTPIQSHAIPLLLDGYDVMASSPTGSGKSIMFGLPLLQRLAVSENKEGVSKMYHGSTGSPAALVISPTRELAAQTAHVLKSFVVPHGPNNANDAVSLNVCLATGGSDLRNQRQQLPTCNVVVGTPGRILQFVDERKLSLGSVEYLVVDEADRLLDMGFEPQLTRIARSLRQGQRGKSFNQEHSLQSVLCSATFPSGVQRLAADFLRPDYYFVSVGRVGATHSNIRQRFQWVNTFLGSKAGRDKTIRQREDPKELAVVRNVQQFWEKTSKANDPQHKKQSNIVVFANTKDGAEKYGKALSRLVNSRKTKNGKQYNGGVRVLHGDKPQSERNKAIHDFKSGKANVLVATDVAARGLDISSIGLVVQADAPRNLDTYTHRVGRTGRAGAYGEAVTLIDSKGGFGIAPGLVDLLRDANQEQYIPSWLQGLAHVSNARSLEDEIAIQAGTSASSVETVIDLGNGTDLSATNEEFTGQDFRRTAEEGSYGSGRDKAYRSFDEEAYSEQIDYSAGIEAETDGDVSISDRKLVETDNTVQSFLVDDSHDNNVTEATPSFNRQTPSRQLLHAIEKINGSTEIGDNPENGIIASLGRSGKGNQKLRFEYIGLFPFDAVSPYLMSRLHGLNEKNEGLEMQRVLMVAEKPSIAKTLAEALSGPRGPRQRRGISRALPVYEFVSDGFLPVNEKNGKRTKCLITVTSVVGHIFSLGFDTQNQTDSNDPADFFHIPVVKQEETTSSKLRVIDHLRALAGESEHLVLWLDCDPEGENIAHEVMAITRQAIYNNKGNSSTDPITRIHRARFSAVSQKALRDAFNSLEEPDPALSRAVDARQELDLRIGVALTRLLTWRCIGIARKRFGPSTRLISYGPCQTPALSFCVDRAREIERFRAEKYWKVNVEASVAHENTVSTFPLRWKVSKTDAVADTRKKIRKGRDSIESTVECASYNLMEAAGVIDQASAPNCHLQVTGVKRTTESIPPPLGLNTVALLVAGSTTMGMSPKQVMNVAEKLYSAGFISYPRTETTRYDPNGFDARATLRQHQNHEEWGRSASYLLRTKYSKSGRPPQRGTDVGDHPPITPLKAATRDQVGGGAAWRVYEFVVRNFIGSLHNELIFTRTTASLALPKRNESEFELSLVNVDSLGFADCCRWILRDIGASGRKGNAAASLKEGKLIPVANARLEEAKTEPPRFLQEHELILLMDRNRIGTDASMAVHVSNIVDRGYVVLCDETGQPLRGPRRPGQKQLPRQIGRYMVPTALGMELIDLFDRENRISSDEMIDSPGLLVHPSIRSQMEEEVKQIAMGKFDKEYCLEKNLDWFEERYEELERSLNRKRIKEFGKGLTAIKDYLGYWRSLGAFEPKNQSRVPKKGSSDKRSKTRQNKKESSRQSKAVKNRRKGTRGGDGLVQNTKKNSRTKKTIRRLKKKHTV